MLYQHLGVAVAFSPRLHALLAEVARRAPVVGARVTLVHAGAPTAQKEALLAEAVRRAGLPADTPMLWRPGSPAAVLVRTAEEQGIDLLVAGALERERPLRYYLGSVARDLVREARCSLLLLTSPSARPEPDRRIVLLTDFSEASVVAYTKALRYAEREAAERLVVLRVVPNLADTVVMLEGGGTGAGFQRRSMAEEQALLRDFVDAAGRRGIPVEPVCVEGTAGAVASAFARERRAHLLVMPSPDTGGNFFERIFPSDMEWVLREIPCNLWVARERA